MKSHHQHQDLLLYTFSEFEALITDNLLRLESSKFVTENKKVNFLDNAIHNSGGNCPYKKFIYWTKNFIAKPNFLLGRTGAVCPYVHLSIKKELFFCTIYSGTFSPNIVEEKLLQYADWFLKLDVETTEQASLKTLAILLDYDDTLDLDISQFMITMHDRLKPKFLSKGLMLGEFFPGHSKSSVWNKDFYPLSSPLPVFVIRYMIDVDYNFLKSNPLHLSSYLKFFQYKISKTEQKKI